MTKLFLGVSVLTVGGILLVSGAQAGGVMQAALRAGDTGVMSQTYGRLKPPCSSCALSGVRRGDLAMLSQQYLPPKTYFNGRMSVR